MSISKVRWQSEDSHGSCWLVHVTDHPKECRPVCFSGSSRFNEISPDSRLSIVRKDGSWEPGTCLVLSGARVADLQPAWLIRTHCRGLLDAFQRTQSLTEGLLKLWEEGKKEAEEGDVSTSQVLQQEEMQCALLIRWVFFSQGGSACPGSAWVLVGAAVIP